MSFTSWFSGLFGPKELQTSLTGEMDEEGYVSKDLFYEILDLDSSIILFFTKEDGWLGANKAFFQTFEYDNIESFRKEHESVRELFEEESEEVFTEYDKSWLDYIRTHKKEGYGISIKDNEGVLHHYRAKARMIKQKGRELYVLELEDISELEDARHRTMEIERIKSKFLANISHEFRTPMNGLLGFIELLEKSDPNEKQSEYLQMINISSRNLMTNIESLLDLAQMQSGRLKISNSEFNLLNEMEELARIYTAAGRDKGINVYFFIDPKLPSFIDGDLRKIKQVINNLINNALKFTKRGGRIFVEVKLLKRQLNGCNIGFSVKDTGQGIAKEHLAFITQPFVSGDQADNRLGVGLSLSHGLIQLLGGELKIQSEVGQGSTFMFALDFKASPEQSMRMVSGKTVKVVLLDEKRVEDANMLTNYLRSFGVNVIKVHLIDENIYQDTDIIYLIASQDESAWLMKLGTYQKKCPAVLLLESAEKLETRVSHVVDHTINKPLLPSTLSAHLVTVFKLPKVKSTKEEIRDERITALVAEDNLINQRLIKILLHEYNIEVVTASNGDEAVKLCEDSDFDIVFMDIDMPVKDGILATQEIKEQRSPTKSGYMPIIALTAMAMEGDREHILDEGLDDYLSKPLTREKLEHVLQKHLKLTL